MTNFRPEVHWYDETAGRWRTSVVEVGQPFICQQIEFTDFPLPEVTIWAGFNGEGWTLYLPPEH